MTSSVSTVGLSSLAPQVHTELKTSAAYQSALLTTPLVILRILASLLQFPPFHRTVFTLLLVIPSLYMS